MSASLFSAKIEYACLAMLELAAHHGQSQPVRVKQIADAHAIPKRFLVQILLQLKGSGMIESTRGAAGGYYLKRNPTDICLGDIIRLIDRAEPKNRQTEAGSSGIESPMMRVVQGVWQEIYTAQQRVLDATTLADLMKRAASESELMYQI